MTDINLSEFSDWLSARKYSSSTITSYLRPLRAAVKKDIMFEHIQDLDVEDCYRVLYCRSAPNRHTARTMFQGIRIYREFLDKRSEA